MQGLLAVDKNNGKRRAMQVAAPAARWALVEIEVIAVRPSGAPAR
jgi:hypothetical protein